MFYFDGMSTMKKILTYFDGNYVDDDEDDNDDDDGGLYWGADLVQSQEQRQTIWRRLNIFAQVS